MKLARFAVVLLVLALSPGTRAELVEIGAVRDNTLYESATGALSNGAGGHFFAGSSGGGNPRRGLVIFDVAGAVPEAATITSVTLTLDMSQTSSGPHPVSLHRVLADWGEGSSVATGNGGGGAPSTAGDATWIHTFFPDELWATTGGDFDPAVSATLVVDALGVYSWSATGMVADVQTWLDDPPSNFGWILVGNESMAQTTKRFGGKDNTDPAVHPVLAIEFEPATPVPAVSGIGALVLMLLMAAAATLALRRRALHL